MNIFLYNNLCFDFEYQQAIAAAINNIAAPSTPITAIVTTSSVQDKGSINIFGSEIQPFGNKISKSFVEIY